MAVIGHLVELREAARYMRGGTSVRLDKIVVMRSIPFYPS